MRFPDCGRCHSNPELRELWGCDGAAEEPLYTITCDPCEGAECDRCGGTGDREMLICPNRMLGGAGEAGRAVARGIRAYQRCEAWGALPVPGGQLAQAAGFEDFCTVVDAERARWDREREEYRRKR